MPVIGKVRVAAGSLNETPLDWDGNKALIIKAIQVAKDKRASILCLPELCITAYGCEDMFHAVHVHQMSLRVLMEILPFTREIIVALSLPLSFRGGVYNVAALVVNGEIAGFYAKQHLASEGVHYEPRWFRAWPKEQVSQINIFGKEYPLGDIMFDVNGLRIGFEICQDAWVADRTGVSLAKRGVDIILNPSASHFAFGKFQVRRRFVREACRAFGVAYVYTNCAGNNSGRTLYDGETLIAAGDEFLGEGRRFSYEDVRVSFADIDIASLRMKRSRAGSIPGSTIDAKDMEVKCKFNFPQIDLAPKIAAEVIPQWEASEHVKAEAFARSVSQGLFDYMRKTYTKGFVVNLSGGADSAATACMVHLMVRLSVEELGIEIFKEKLSYFNEIQSAATIEEIMPNMLYCLYQRSEFSSTVTLSAASKLAKSLNASFYEYPVDKIVASYLEGMNEIMHRELDWQHDDLALQNIQARVRGPSAWLLANIKGAILLTTSNRSEAAVGYTTMDGDTCGGLSPIGGIDKAYLMQWLRWLETTGPLGIGPIPALDEINSHPPTAELRPSEMQQTDEKDLMPYSLLAIIERKAVHDKLGPVEIYKSIKQEEYSIDNNALISFIQQYFKLWSQNQWKRERYAPSFHVDDQNLDPKSWCRFPILSGGFERELQQLEKFRKD